MKIGHSMWENIENTYVAHEPGQVVAEAHPQRAFGELLDPKRSGTSASGDSAQFGDLCTVTLPRR